MRPDHYALPGPGERCARKITRACAAGFVRSWAEKKPVRRICFAGGTNAKVFDIRAGDGVCWNKRDAGAARCDGTAETDCGCATDQRCRLSGWTVSGQT